MCSRLTVPRRRILAGVAGVGVVSLAGCGGPSDDSEAGTDDDPNENEDYEGETDEYPNDNEDSVGGGTTPGGDTDAVGPRI